MEGRGFREDINGLRGWAVLAVLLYHFGVPGFGGGFAGVDVFFVISGFLMAGIVERGLAQGHFSLLRFYAARAIRIWPALLVVCLLLLGLGWFLLSDSEYARLGKHVRDTLLFSSNLRYAAEAGYFDSASHGKWLLHSWSLSLEWQFYLIFPLLYAGLRRWPGPARLPRVLAALALLSLGLSQWLVLQEPTDAFYRLSSRAWELLAGSLACLLALRWQPGTRLAACLHWGGMLLVLLSILCAGQLPWWPGLAALLPVVGAVLVVLAGCSSPLVRGRGWQWLGDASYSIYLWHWPLMALLYYAALQREPLWLAVGLLLSLLLGALSWRWIEQPARRLCAGWHPLRSLALLVLLFAVVSVLAQQVRLQRFTGRLPAPVQALASEADNRNRQASLCMRRGEVCHFGGPRIRLILLGDSHAAALASAVAAALPAGDGLLLRASSGCLLAEGGQRPGRAGRACDQLLRWVAEELPRLHPGVPLLVINRTTAYAFGGLDGVDGEVADRPIVHFSREYERPEPAFLREFRQHYLDTLCTLTARRRVYLLQPLPEMPFNVPVRMARDRLLGLSRALVLPLADYQARHAPVLAMQQEAAARCGVQLLDPLPLLCHEQGCPADQLGRPRYVDDDHLSESGNRLLTPLFRRIPDGG